MSQIRLILVYLKIMFVWLLVMYVEPISTGSLICHLQRNGVKHRCAETNLIWHL